MHKSSVEVSVMPLLTIAHKESWMAMNIDRRVWQHVFEDRSESQLSDAFESADWIVQRLRRDYGEDLYARPVENGNPTGQDFFIQLKGTDDVDQYRLRTGEWLSYPVDLSNLVQWHSYTLPVIFVVWDIVSKVGYWTHIQPFIRGKLESDSTWLENRSGAKEPTRNVRVPANQIVAEDNLDSLRSVIKAEWRKIEQGKRHFEILYRARTYLADDTQSLQLPPVIARQLRITELQAIVTADANEAEGWLDLAAVYYEVDNVSEALKAINRAWSLDPKNGNTRQVRACILAEYARRKGGLASMLHEAISLLQSVRSGPIDSMADYNIGNCYSELGQFQKAVEHYDRALSAEPEPREAAQIWTNHGNAVDKIGNTQDAVQSFRNALDLNPSLWNAHASWAALEVRQEHFKEACEHFHDAFRGNSELQSSGDGIVFWFAYSLHKIGEFEEALSITNDLLAVSPTHEEGLLLKAYLLRRLSQGDDSYTTKALAFLKDRLLDDPANMQVRSELHQLYIEQELEDEHRVLLEETVSFEHAPPIALHEFARLLEHDDRISEAIACLERAATQEGTDAQLYHTIVHTLARLKRETGKHSEAITYYEMALKDVSNPSPILEKMSDCYHSLNDYVNCVVVITRALLLGAAGVSWWNNLYFALDELRIEPEQYTAFLHRKLWSGEDVPDHEIRAKLNALISPAA